MIIDTHRISYFSRLTARPATAEAFHSNVRFPATSLVPTIPGTTAIIVGLSFSGYSAVSGVMPFASIIHNGAAAFTFVVPPMSGVTTQPVPASVVYPITGSYLYEANLDLSAVTISWNDITDAVVRANVLLVLTANLA